MTTLHGTSLLIATKTYLYILQQKYVGSENPNIQIVCHMKYTDTNNIKCDKIHELTHHVLQ